MIAVNLIAIITTIACYVNRGQNLEEKICRKWGTDAFAFKIEEIVTQTQWQQQQQQQQQHQQQQQQHYNSSAMPG